MSESVSIFGYTDKICIIVARSISSQNIFTIYINIFTKTRYYDGNKIKKMFRMQRPVEMGINTNVYAYCYDQLLNAIDR